MNNQELQFKLCSECKTMIPKSTYKSLCPKCKSKKAKEYNTRAKAVYESKRWKTVRDKMRRENVFCEICKEIGDKLRLATEVHHIIKANYGMDDTFYDESNLISICNEHHRMIEGMTKSQLIKALRDGSLIIKEDLE